MRHLGRHAYALAQRRVRVYGFADVHCVCAHLYGQSDFANQVACVGSEDAAAQDLALATASMAVSQSSFGAVVKQELGNALGAAVGGGHNLKRVGRRRVYSHPSTFKPFTLLNSRPLRVTMIRPCVLAWAASHRSLGPMGVPLARRSARMLP